MGIRSSRPGEGVRGRSPHGSWKGRARSAEGATHAGGLDRATTRGGSRRFEARSRRGKAPAKALSSACSSAPNRGGPVAAPRASQPARALCPCRRPRTAAASRAGSPTCRAESRQWDERIPPGPGPRTRRRPARTPAAPKLGGTPIVAFAATSCGRLQKTDSRRRDGTNAWLACLLIYPVPPPCQQLTGTLWKNERLSELDQEGRAGSTSPNPA